MKRGLLTLTQIGAVFLTGFGDFYTRIAPPQDDLRFWSGLASIAAAVVFIIIAAVKDKVPIAILVISAVLTICCPLLYYVNYQALTVPYGRAQLICGTVYTPKGADYVSKNPGETREEIVRDFVGQTGEIWTENSINRSRMILGLSYLAGVASLAFTALVWIERAKKPNTRSGS